MRCIHCQQVLPADGPRVLCLQLRGSRGECIELRWCLEGCADEDPLHLRMADSLAMDGDEGLQATRLAYSAIRDRAALRCQRAPHRLREHVRIRRDIEGPDTMRGPGLSWGVPTARRRR